MAYIQTGIPSKDLLQVLPKLREAMQDLNDVWANTNDDELTEILNKKYPFDEDFESTLVSTCNWIDYCIAEIENPTSKEREFIVKDNSGRGGVNTVTESFAKKHFENVFIDENDENENFYTWLETSEIGDVFSYDNATVFTRSK